MQIVDYRPVLCLRFVVLVFQDGRGRPGIAGEEKTETVLQIVEHFVANGRGSDRNAVILVELETRNAAVCGDELVLLADWLAKQVDLDVAGLLGERMGADDIALASV